MSNKIQLPDGKFLIKDYGKYNSGLIFISATGKIPQQEYHPKDFNLIGTHTIYGTKGYFYISKAGNPCFRIDENGEHILLKEQWECYNPANYYLKFENEEEFVRRLEKVLLEEEKRNDD